MFKLVTKGDKRPRAFTLIELILVMFIMLLLTLITLPMLSQFLKTTKVQQTVQIISTVLWRARSEAIRTRRLVGVYFGDDVSRLNPQPLPGILPPKNHIEMWTVLTNNDSDGIGSAESPLGNAGDWYPYKDPDQNLTSEPITWPDGVRVLAGLFQRGGGNPPWIGYGWNASYQRSSVGEIKRHNVTFSRTGTMPGWYDGLNTYDSVLIFDETSGEHVILWVGEWLVSSKPRILPFKLTGIFDLSGNYHALTDYKDLPKYVDQ